MALSDSVRLSAWTSAPAAQAPWQRTWTWRCGCWRNGDGSNAKPRRRGGIDFGGYDINEYIYIVKIIITIYLYKYINIYYT
jgi:hypothetical protein